MSKDIDQAIDALVTHLTENVIGSINPETLEPNGGLYSTEFVLKSLLTSIAYNYGYNYAPEDFWCNVANDFGNEFDESLNEVAGRELHGDGYKYTTNDLVSRIEPY